jgi:hypothetical protein
MISIVENGRWNNRYKSSNRGEEDDFEALRGGLIIGRQGLLNRWLVAPRPSSFFRLIHFISLDANDVYIEDQGST